MPQMKIGIMQPYLFPYIGYFQLINAVNRFVIHDDVQYIKGGWINRNRIQVQNEDHLFTFSLKKDRSFNKINARVFSSELFREKIAFLRFIKFNYKSAPYFSESFDLLEEILSINDNRVSPFITNSLKLICGYLDIDTSFYISSELKKNNELKGQNRVVEICQKLKGNIYINLSGGKKLYSKEVFKEHGIKLLFLETGEIEYEFGKSFFIPNLSIIDVLMYNSRQHIKELLKQCSIS